jgi:uncharacterized protein DUF998
LTPPAGTTEGVVLLGEREGPDRAATWAKAALTCFAAAVLVVLTLDFTLFTAVDPIHQVISDYAVFGGAVPLAFSALALAVGTIALLVALASAGVTVTAGVRVLTGAWAAGLSLCAFFRTTLPGAPPSASGEIHRYAGVALFVGLPGALQLLARQLRRRRPWRRVAGRIQVWTRWAWVALVAFLLSQLPALAPATQLAGEVLPQGLVERMLFLVYLAPLGELAVAVLGTTESAEGKSC